jgi:peroxiredoxin
MLLILLSVTFFVGCRQEFNVIFPDRVPDEIEQYMQKCEYIVVIYIDSAECTPCSLNHLSLWKVHKKELEKHNAGILLVVRNSDEQAVINALKAIKTVFPFITDKGGRFKAINGISQFAKSNTFVMDKNKNVVFAEYPVTDEKTWKRFIKRIK